MTSTAAVSLVSTVLNDRTGVSLFFRRMEEQTVRPEEIVIVDGGSSDGTWELLEAEAASAARPWRLIALREPRCNVARGRNLAIMQASNDLIASTDIGCDWDPEWLQELIAPLEADSSVELVIGSWETREVDLVGPWAKTEFALKGPLMRTAATPQTQATSRAIAYRRAVWQKLGGYPEDLTLAGDDTVFDLLFKAAGVRVAAAPAVRCYWHRHERLKGFLKEQYRYFLGNGEALITLDYPALVGGRMLFELLGGIGAMVALSIPGLRLIGAGLLALALASIALRFRRWIPASRRLATMGVNRPLCRVAVFETLLRINAIRGYVYGFWRGQRRCRQTRQRLRSPPDA